MTDVTDVRAGVRIEAWGVAPVQAEFAVMLAGQRPAAKWWDVKQVERLGGETCPLDVDDPASIAGARGAGWAYVVYPAGRGSS